MSTLLVRPQQSYKKLKRIQENVNLVHILFELALLLQVFVDLGKTLLGLYLSPPTLFRIFQYNSKNDEKNKIQFVYDTNYIRFLWCDLRNWIYKIQNLEGRTPTSKDLDFLCAKW